MIYNPKFVSTIKKILSVVCNHCYRLPLISKERETKIVLNEKRRRMIMSLKPSRRLEMVKNLLGNDAGKCPFSTKKGKKDLYCPTFVKVVPSEGGIGFSENPSHRGGKKEDTGKTPKRDYVVRDVYNILINIGGTPEDNEHNELLGLTKEHMRGFFVSHMLVPPPVYRQRTNLGKSHALSLCVQRVMTACVQYQINVSLLDTEIKLFDALEEYIKEWDKIIKGKKGVARGQVGGTRVDFASRATMYPAKIPLGVGLVPARAARDGLYVPATITAENIDYYQQLYFDGKIHSHKKMKNGNLGRWVNISYNNIQDRSFHFLEIGDQIRAEIGNGSIDRSADLYMTGRQPTQNLLNMHSAFARIIEADPKIWSLFGEDYTSSLSFNMMGAIAGDFDGDQNPMTAPQLEEAIVDMMNMLHVRYMRTYQNPTSAIGFSHNATIAFMILSILPDFYEVVSEISEDQVEKVLLELIPKSNRDKYRLNSKATQEEKKVHFREMLELKARYLHKLGEFMDTHPRRFHFKYIGEVPKGKYIVKIPSISKALFDNCIYTYAFDKYREKFDEKLSKYGVHKYSGRGLISSIFPSTFAYENNSKKNKVVIKEGIFIKGILTDSVVGTGPGGIMDRITLFYHNEDPNIEHLPGRANLLAAAVSNNGLFMTSTFIEQYGATVSYQDLDYLGAQDADPRIRKAFNEMRLDVLKMKTSDNPYEEQEYLDRVQKKANTLMGLANIIDKQRIDEYKILKEQHEKNPSIKLPPPSTPVYNYEMDEKEYKKKEEEGTLTEYDRNVRFIKNGIIMLSEFGSGAKGKESNLARIAVYGGVQTVMGSMLKQTVTGNKRITVMNRIGSLDPESIGNVMGSYAKGYTVLESHVHSQADRVGQSSTAITSGKLGTIQRELQIAMNNVESYQGGTVSNGKILEYVSGCDGLDSLYLMQIEAENDKFYLPLDIKGQVSALVEVMDDRV